MRQPGELKERPNHTERKRTNGIDGKMQTRTEENRQKHKEGNRKKTGTTGT
jgi:hypothetical protein